MEVSQLSKLFDKKSGICGLSADWTETDSLESRWVVIWADGCYPKGVKVHKMLKYEPTQLVAQKMLLSLDQFIS